MSRTAAPLSLSPVKVLSTRWESTRVIARVETRKGTGNLMFRVEKTQGGVRYLMFENYGIDFVAPRMDRTFPKLVRHVEGLLEEQLRESLT